MTYDINIQWDCSNLSKIWTVFSCWHRNVLHETYRASRKTLLPFLTQTHFWLWTLKPKHIKTTVNKMITLAC